MTNDIDSLPLPLVSIGVPIYNEEKYLAESLNDLLHQDYSNLEIIISDNGSTDCTQDICRKYAASDTRIKYHRFDTNQGVTRNFKKVLQLSNGKYFMWAAGHDRWSPNFISECVKLLEQKPTAVIAFASSSWIDEDNNPHQKYSGWTDTQGLDVIGRFYSVFWGNMHPILGLMRASAVKQAREIMSIAGTDLVFLSDLALQGDFVHAVKTSWARREFRGKETFKQRMLRYNNDEYRLTGSIFNKLFPLIGLPIHLIKTVINSKNSLLDRFFIIFTLLPSLPAKYFLARKRQG